MSAKVLRLPLHERPVKVGREWLAQVREMLECDRDLLAAHDTLAIMVSDRAYSAGPEHVSLANQLRRLRLALDLARDELGKALDSDWDWKAADVEASER